MEFTYYKKPKYLYFETTVFGLAAKAEEVFSILLFSIWLLQGRATAENRLHNQIPAAGGASIRRFTSGNQMMWRRWFSEAARRFYRHSESSKIPKTSSTLESVRKNRYQKYFFGVNSTA